MKQEKKKQLTVVGLVAACVLLMCFVSPIYALFESDDSCQVIQVNQHIFQTNTSFYISDTGEARVYVDYAVYDAMQDVEITIRIAKKGMFIFWDDILSETYTASGEYYYHAYRYDIAEVGTYRCTVTYTVISEDGKKDIITFEDTAVYDGAAHTDDIEETTLFETTAPEETTAQTETTIPEETTAQVETTTQTEPEQTTREEKAAHSVVETATGYMEYDGDGRLVREVLYDEKGELYMEKEYGEETIKQTRWNGKWLASVETLTYDQYTLESISYHRNGTISTHSRYEYISGTSLLSKSVTMDANGVVKTETIYTYDENGKKTQRDYYAIENGEKTLVSYTQYVYWNDLLVQEKFCDAQSDYVNTTYYQYDPMGRLVCVDYDRMKISYWYHGSGKISRKEVIDPYQTVVTEYDVNGKLLRTTTTTKTVLGDTEVFVEEYK